MKDEVIETKPWFGKLLFLREGVEMYETFATEAEAKAYLKGTEHAKHALDPEDENDEYDFIIDQLEPMDEA